MRYSTFTKGRPASAASWALRIFDAATICIALVICAVLLMDRIRRRKSRGLFINQDDQDAREKCGFHLQVCLNWSVAAFTSAVKSGLSAFSRAIVSSSSGFRVFRNSVSLV